MGARTRTGIDFVKSASEGFERYLALYQTPQEDGGCKDCRFFLMCKGQCPGTAIDGDWRNRTEHCQVWMTLFRQLEEELLDQAKSPLSARPLRRQIEQDFLKVWASGRNTTINGLMKLRAAKATATASDSAGHKTTQPARTARGGHAAPSGRARAAGNGSAGRATQRSVADAYGLNRLGFQLDDFTRLSWVSDNAQAVWHPRIRRIGQAWAEIEWRAVLEGLRRCSVTVTSPEGLPARAGQFARHGLNTLPVAIEGTSNQSYSNTAVKPVVGARWAYRIVVGKPGDVTAFQEAWEAADQEAIGSLLGYPPCCRRFFHELWVDHGMRDTTWPMALATGSNGAASTDGTLEVGGPPVANILWRWMGVRAVSHLPCRFDCDATAKIGAANVELGRAAGYAEEMEWLLEMLGWPIQWSALHGIAEIKTPILKVSAATDATAGKYVVRRPGIGYPDTGAQGLGFPYRVAALSSVPMHAVPAPLRIADTGA